MLNLQLIPDEFKKLDRFIAWKQLGKDGKQRKTPISTEGFPISYRDPTAVMSFPSIQTRCNQSSDTGCGITLLDGLQLEVDSKRGFLWCADFDGFRSLNGKLCDDFVMQFLKATQTYVEISPSGTGFKCFFISD